jgi:tetratricopeptide (TPR) repeat protein
MVMGRNDEAIAELKRAESLDPLSLIISADLADVLCVAHRYDESVQQSRKAIEMDPHKSRQSHNSSTDASIALIYVELGDNDRAMIWLNKAYEARFNPSILMRPVFDPLRAASGFQDLLRRIGLPTRDAVVGRQHANQASEPRGASSLAS